MMALIINLLFMPVCAVIAGLMLWRMDNNEEIEDSKLFKEFMLLLMACMLLVWGTINTDAVRMYIDPPFRIQTELDAHPVYAALKRTAPSDYQPLHDFLVVQINEGATIDEAFIQARPQLQAMANSRLGFADQAARVQWAGFTVKTLRELQAANPELCYQFMASQPFDKQALATAFSADNTRAFQAALVTLLDSADLGMSDKRPSGDKPVEFNVAAREFGVIKDVISAQFGESVANTVSRKTFPAQPNDAKEQLCAARIVQLDEMLKRPKAMAAMLVDSALR